MALYTVRYVRPSKRDFMSNIILKTDRVSGKDCPDWCPLKDGTLTGDPKYCDHSLDCKQTDVYAKGFITHWYKFRNVETGEEDFDYFCTGMYPENYRERAGIDEKVS